MKTSSYNPKTNGKGEFFIVGTEDEIKNLAASQKRYVGDKFDIDGAIACVCVEDLCGYSRFNDHFITGTDHNGNIQKFKCGPQCGWLWAGSHKRPYCWQDKICDFLKLQNLSKLYVLSVFFKNDKSILDGNPFIGGTQEKNETLLQTAYRELFEEVGLRVNKNANLYEIPTVSKHKCIWLVDAKEVYDAKCMPKNK